MTSLTARNFRSIRGEVTISLDAPTVLIHGPNGTGKTSLLSAIELGLTGAVASLARFDPSYLTYLPHKLSPDSSAYVSIQADEKLCEGTGGTLTANGATIHGQGKLSEQQARFYTERCYLAQATLGRLLEIYEHQDARNTDSPLTRFVKEMLGLDALDALIDGLHLSGDVRRFREPSPVYWAARADAPDLDRDVAAASAKVETAESERDQIEVNLRALIGSTLATGQAIVPDRLRPDLERRAREHEEKLAGLARIRRDINAAATQVAAATNTEAGSARAEAERASAAAREALTRWQAESGARLEALLTDVQQAFPEIPASSSDPSAAHSAAKRVVEAARARLRRTVDADDATTKALGEISTSVTQGQGRVDAIDRELAAKGGANRELAEALSAISAHINDDHCPVCGRDYAELDDGPLAAHVSREIGRLVTAAGRIEALVSDRSNTVAALTDARRKQTELQGTVLSPSERERVVFELAQREEWLTGLQELEALATVGSRLIRDVTQSAQVLAALDGQTTSISGLRAELDSYAPQLGIEPHPVDTPLATVIQSMSSELDRQETDEGSAKANVERALTILRTFAASKPALEDAKRELGALKEKQTISATRRQEADRRIAVAKDLLTRAQAVRGNHVRNIFNDELNAIWRQLFIRLAPDENFVPAFAIPQVAGKPVEAVLETHYRSGGKGGNPRAMLSAGNLNTAALTLFLSLHLSVRPKLPWLVIDDPVQSMDDVHIAQFAALLRTLKQHGRQVIIAVHDRQLFDYLSLELSPTFNGDRLITVELGRNAEGFTTAPWALTTFEPDRAVAA
jgi:exonuclease SbcC